MATERHNGEYLFTTIHDFKSNIAKYIRALENMRYRAIVIRRYNKPVALVTPYQIAAAGLRLEREEGSGRS